LSVIITKMNTVITNEAPQGSKPVRKPRVKKSQEAVPESLEKPAPVVTPSSPVMPTPDGSARPPVPAAGPVVEEKPKRRTRKPKEAAPDGSAKPPALIPVVPVPPVVSASLAPITPSEPFRGDGFLCVPNKDRAKPKTKKQVLKEELLVKEAEEKARILEREAEIRRQALDEMHRLEQYKMDLLREQIAKEIEAEAKKELRKAKSSQKTAEATKEKRKTKKEVVKQMMPDTVPEPVAPQPEAPSMSSAPVGMSSPMIGSMPVSSASRITFGNYNAYIQRRFGY
jgi:hypothetical protein